MAEQFGSIPSTTLPSLPTPKPRVNGLSDGGLVVQVPVGSSAGSTFTNVTFTQQVEVTVPNIPQLLLDDPSFDLRLELMRYRRKTAYDGSSAYKCYVHPSNAPATSGDGNHTHGGEHGGSSSAVAALRVTEWQLTSHGQVTDVSQSMASFMIWKDVEYRTATGSGNVNCLCPSTGNTKNVTYYRFPYQAIYSPGYFKFRCSIVDPTDERGQRLTGPESEVVSITSERHPFPVFGYDGSGYPYTDATGVDTTRIGAWIGETSRLPR